MSLSASDYDDFTRIRALYKLYYLLTYLLSSFCLACLFSSIHHRLDYFSAICAIFVSFGLLFTRLHYFLANRPTAAGTRNKIFYWPKAVYESDAKPTASKYWKRLPAWNETLRPDKPPDKSGFTCNHQQYVNMPSEDLIVSARPIHCNYQFVHYSGLCRISPSILNRFKPNLQA